MAEPLPGPLLWASLSFRRSVSPQRDVGKGRSQGEGRRQGSRNGNAEGDDLDRVPPGHGFVVHRTMVAMLSLRKNLKCAAENP